MQKYTLGKVESDIHSWQTKKDREALSRACKSVEHLVLRFSERASTLFKKPPRNAYHKIDTNEAISDCWQIVLRCADRYLVGGNSKFSTFVYTRLLWYSTNPYNEAMTKQCTFSLIPMDKTTPASTVYQSVEESVLKKIWINKLMEKLKPDEKEFIQLLADGHTTRSISVEKGYSESWGGQKRRSIARKLGALHGELN